MAEAATETETVTLFVRQSADKQLQGRASCKAKRPAVSETYAFQIILKEVFELLHKNRSRTLSLRSLPSS